jgi:SAP domain
MAKSKPWGYVVVRITKQYSAAASRAGSAAEKTADLWTQGMRQVIDRTYLLRKLPQVDLVPPVERYFDFVQRTVELNRGVTVRWAQAATSLSDAVRQRAESAGEVMRERADSVGGLVRGKAGTIEQTARDEAAKAAKATRQQAEEAEQAEHERVREARRIERQRARQGHQRARERYEGMTKAELSDQLARRGLPKTGNVDELVERLVEADNW